MLSLYFQGGIPAELAAGFREIAPLLGLREAPDGLCVSLTQGDSLSIAPHENGCAVTYSTPAEFFRALGLLARYGGKPAPVAETAVFSRCGVMLDCSRNAVLTVDAVKNILRRMALMGLDLAMMYTEDTYTVPSRPYFGYLRGRYTQEELRELDEYAALFGIEMIPCIQTLAHLERALQFPCMESYRDTPEILLVGEDATYGFLREIIAAASAPFRSKRIHIGMDEASWVGRGQYLNKNGYHPTSELMKEHLERVHEILKEQGLEAMMWSDMHFTAARPGGGIYHPDTEFTPEILAGAPADIDLVYWDYYHENEKLYDTNLQKHALFQANTVFAGGIWTWLGPATDYRKTMAAAWPALEQCRRHGVCEVFATAWQDDGAEANLTSILYGLQLFAEYRYTAKWDSAELAARFRATCGADANAFLAMSRFNELPGMERREESTANPCKMLVYEDPMMPMFEKDLPGDYAAYYAALEREFTQYREENPDYRLLMDAYVKLAGALRLKSAFRSTAAKTVRAKDREGARSLVPLAGECAEALEALRGAWYALWMSTNKPFGFEVLDTRLGGVIARCRTAQTRLAAFADGTLADIPELSCEKLPVLLDENGKIGCNNSWTSYISTSRVGLQ